VLQFKGLLLTGAVGFAPASASAAANAGERFNAGWGDAQVHEWWESKEAYLAEPTLWQARFSAFRRDRAKQ